MQSLKVKSPINQTFQFNNNRERNQWREQKKLDRGNLGKTQLG